MKSIRFHRLVLCGVVIGFLGFSLQAYPVMVKPGTFAGVHHKKTKRVDRHVKSEVFSEWKGETLVTDSGKYCISASVKIYDYAHTRDGKRQYKHQPIVDLVYINHKLSQVIIRPCK